MSISNGIAHVRESDRTIQSLADHLFESAALSGMYADKIGLKHIGELAGLIHRFDPLLLEIIYVELPHVHYFISLTQPLKSLAVFLMLSRARVKTCFAPLTTFVSQTVLFLGLIKRIMQLFPTMFLYYYLTIVHKIC